MRKLSEPTMKASVPVRVGPFEGLCTGFSPAFRPLRAYVCRRASSPQVEIGQCERNEGAIGILREPAIAHLREAPQALHNSEHVFNPCANLRLVAVLAPRHFVDDALAARTLMGEVAGLWCLPRDQRFLARVRAVAVHALLLSVQQLWQRMLVMHIRGRHNCAMSQPALTVDPDMKLHAEIPLLALRV